ncbi:ectoine hydroxylase [Mucilaginibacter oryzae]|uniref:Ectoine hydroxylase n=1 Tax=Mucilaginibacter oryzae TaxID=468058 RepID=A0A316HGN8_9SPHI|nr:phytanoyl-CoA dioxygenase family protein [Mucilaginibacter oryzae]PWK79547.1 ectoine hydroxylase [Mucilaginibacter oryzae]
MTLSEFQISNYDEIGYLFIENVFSQEEVGLLLNEMKLVISENCDRRILDKKGSVRSFFAPEWNNQLFADTINLEKLVVPAKQLLRSDVYKHQTKLNTKQALVGDWWEWHQDFTYWHKEDGMPKPNVLTAMIYLNDVNEFNGPLIVIPGSHKKEDIDVIANNSNINENDGWFADYHKSTDYMSSLTTDLKYTLKEHMLSDVMKSKGIHSIKGTAGSVVFFHGNLFHASSNNLSPWDRHTFLITYNSIENKLPTIENPRPSFISNRQFEVIIPNRNSLTSN